MDIRDRRLKARLSKWGTCSVETKRGLVKPRKVIMFKRFLSYYEPQMGLFVADTVCALVLAAIDLAFPIILRNLTGGLFTQGQAAIMQALGMIAVGLVLMYAVRCACRYFVSYWGHVMGARMESKMREDLFDQYERFSFAYFDRNSSGDMMSRVVNDLFDICEAAHHVPEWIIICGIEIIGSFVILFTIAPVLALAMAVVTAAFAVIMFWQNMRMREVFSDNRKKSAASMRSCRIRWRACAWSRALPMRRPNASSSAPQTIAIFRPRRTCITPWASIPRRMACSRVCSM